MNSPLGAPPLIKMSIYVPADVRRSLKVEAASRGMTMGDVIVEALQTRIRFTSREEK